MPELDAKLKYELVQPPDAFAALNVGQRMPSVLELSPLLRQVNPYQTHRQVVDAIRTLATACISSQFSHLPLPTRVRASGALAMWESLAEQLPELRAARALLSDSGTRLPVARKVLKQAVEPYLRADQPHDDAISLACSMLLFWWRHGALYEPTRATSTLFAETECAADVPLSQVKPPVHTLFISPTEGHRPVDGEVESIQMLSSPAGPEHPWASRILTLVSFNSDSSSDWVELLVHKTNDESISVLYDRHGEAIRAHYHERHGQEVAEGRERHWRQVWDYVIKVLVHLNLDNAVIGSGGNA
jgi:hypothetical protein